MKKIFFLILLVQYSFSQEFFGGKACSIAKQGAFSKSQKAARVAFPGDPSLDIKYHHIDLKINLNTRSLAGKVNTKFIAVELLNKCFFDLKNAFVVDSVVENNKKLSFEHKNNKLAISLGRNIQKDQLLDLTIYYHGKPPSSNFGSFSFGTQGSSSSPVVWSLSEPYGAPDWCPCKDDPSDKIDSSRVSVTLPASMISVSNGLLESEKLNVDGTKTTTWKNSNLIAHYLISIACSNYFLYQDSYSYNGKTMPILHYLYPQSFNQAIKTQLDQTKTMLSFFSDLFGEYPFLNEKYGHAMCNFPGGMEHQTISSMGGFTESLIAHELAHQWFGNKITCKTWSDIFINEGFASYSEALFDEFKYGKARYQATINAHIQRAKTTSKSVYIENPEDEFEIFDYDLSYGKGAVVLHTLRGYLGDELFFKTLKNFQNSNHAFGSATVDDFKIVAEATSGKNLNTFFDQWVYGKGYPKYNLSWTSLESNNLRILIDQQKNQTKPEIFKSPIQFLVSFENRRDSIVVLDVDNLNNEYLLTGFSAKVKNLTMDPNNFIIKDLTVGNLPLGTESLPSDFIFPNPVEDFIYFKNNEWVQLSVFDVTGRLIISRDLFAPKINVENLKSGKYFITLKNKGQSSSFSFYKL